MKLLKKGSITKADIFILDEKDSGQVFRDYNKKILLKSFKHKPWFIKISWGRLVTAREVKILQKLKGINGIPKLIKYSKYELFESFIEGTPLSVYGIKNGKLTEEYFIKIYQIIEEMYKRRVVHLDLRLSSNYILTPERDAAIIDFNTAFYIYNIPFIGNMLLKFCKIIDKTGVIKMKYQFCRESITCEEKKLFKRINHLRRLWIFTPVGENTWDNE